VLAQRRSNSMPDREHLSSAFSFDHLVGAGRSTPMRRIARAAVRARPQRALCHIDSADGESVIRADA
jgi:hypothetical protein